MYRIRLVTGQEQVYPSIQELTAGVQRGEVTAEAEIYHQRSDRWLSIESHPHYRMAVEGGTATRTSRLKFTRPSTPAAKPDVLPTPVAQKPDQGDLEELNRLLVLLDPLPTPAQRAEPEPAAPQSPPELTLIHPEAPKAPVHSDDPEPVFGTMLRLEDLDSAAEPEPVEFAPEPVESVLDEVVLNEEPEAVAMPDLGLPATIHFDEIPVPERQESTPEVEEVAAPAEAFAFEAASPIAEAIEPEPAPAVAPSFEAPPLSFDPSPAHDAPLPHASGARFRPMLYVAAAAIVAAAIYAFTAGGSEADQGMVTLASATAPAAGAKPAPLPPVDSAPVTPPSSVGFPVADMQNGAGDSLTAAAADSAAGFLPSAPTIDLPSAGTAEVSAGVATPRASMGGGAELARGYASTYGTLSREFSAQMDRSGLVRLFSQTQLTTNDGLAGARRALDAAASAVRRYHVMEGVIEKAYQDSARALERAGASPTDLRDWMTHPSLKESKEAADEGARLIGQIDAVFALLQAQSGHYRINGSEVRFDDSDARARYAELQSWITRRLEHWSGQPASSVPTTVRPLLDGIGLTRLPIAR